MNECAENDEEWFDLVKSIDHDVVSGVDVMSTNKSMYGHWEAKYTFEL